MKTGIELIAEERKEQLEKHGFDEAHDDDFNKHYQLSAAAGILTYLDEEDYDYDIDATCPGDWDEILWRYMMKKPYKERLIIAGALIAAEIDRLQRIE